MAGPRCRGTARYAAAKAGLEGLTRQLALDLGPRQTTVNCVAPGVVEVESYFRDYPDYRRDEAARQVPIGRVGFPPDIAGMVAFLISGQADFLYRPDDQLIDGGQLARLSLPAVMKPDAKWETRFARARPRATVLADLAAHPLRPDPTWKPAGSDAGSILRDYPDPLRALSEAAVPALILRNVFPPAECQSLIQRFISRGLLPAPGNAVTAAELPQADRHRHQPRQSRRRPGGRSFSHATAETNALFKTLFDGFKDPVAALYQSLSAVAAGKTVLAAREPDGRRYSPAIFRVHYGDHAYAPHFDSVRLREKRANYAVSRFQHQFAGILCLQNDSPAGGEHADHSPPVSLDAGGSATRSPAGSFHAYAAEHGIGCCRVELNPGDLYFFNTRCIHEVPALQGASPRIVLAVFIGYSPEDEKIFVWS